MSRTLFPLLSLSLALCMAGLSNCSWDGASQEVSAARPNIVFILIDDLGWPDLSVYGHRFHETPHIDRLASQGLRFTNAYAAAPVCSPTRASIMSGQYPAHVGITDFIPGHWRPFEQLIVPTNRTQSLPNEVVTFAEVLQAQGYRTGYFGKWHLGDDQGYTPDQQGFQSWTVFRGWGHFDLENKLFPGQQVAPDEYLADVLTRKSLDFIEENRAGPFLLFLSHFAVHIPLEASERLIQKYEGRPRPEQGVNNPVYAAMIEHVDDSVGQILEKLDELGLSANTAVVFFSDNGGLQERFDKADGVVVSTNEPLRDEKGSLYEGGIRVPLIVRWPDVVSPGTVSTRPVTSVDLYPTLLEMAGVEPPSSLSLDGKSLVPLLRGQAADPERAIFWHYPHYHHSVPAGAVRQGPHKLIEFYDDGHLELYNLEEDIGERNNLSGSLPDKALQMQQLLTRWRTSVNADMPIPNPEFDEVRRKEWGMHPDRRRPPEWNEAEN